MQVVVDVVSPLLIGFPHLGRASEYEVIFVVEEQFCHGGER